MSEIQTKTNYALVTSNNINNKNKSSTARKMRTQQSHSASLLKEGCSTFFCFFMFARQGHNTIKLVTMKKYSSSWDLVGFPINGGGSSVDGLGV